MPELPEVETVRDGLEKAAAGKRISKILIRRRDLRTAIPEDFEQPLTGGKILSCLRRGKYIILPTDGGRAAILHLGMSGRVRIYGPGDSSDRQKHDHAVFSLEDGTQIVFHDPRRFGLLYHTDAHAWETAPPFASMGPEPLDKWTADHLLAALQNRRSAIKTALLDQSVVAGLGNIYVCEALYKAGISPLRPADSLDAADAARLVACVRDVLADAIASGGSSLKDYRHTDGSLGYFQHRFAVYDRESQKCPACTCETGILRIVQGGRSTFYCPQRQKQGTTSIGKQKRKRRCAKSS